MDPDEPPRGDPPAAAVLLYGSLFSDGMEWNGSLIFWSSTFP